MEKSWQEAETPAEASLEHSLKDSLMYLETRARKGRVEELPGAESSMVKEEDWKELKPWDQESLRGGCRLEARTLWAVGAKGQCLLSLKELLAQELEAGIFQGPLQLQCMTGCPQVHNRV